MALDGQLYVLLSRKQDVHLTPTHTVHMQTHILTLNPEHEPTYSSVILNNCLALGQFDMNT